MADERSPAGHERTEGSASAVRRERRRATGDHPAATLDTRPPPVSRPGRRAGQTGAPIGGSIGGQSATAPVPEVAAPLATPPDTFEDQAHRARADGPPAGADLGPPSQLARGEVGRTAPSAVTLVVGGRLPRRQRRRLDQAARLRARQSDSRLRLVYDTRGPAVRLGLIWVGLLAGALWLGQGALALLFAALAAVTSLQIAQAWRAVGMRPRPSRLLCALIGAVCPLAALEGSGGLGLAVVGSVVACVAGGAVLAHRARGARAPGALGIAFASATLRCGFFAGLAAACVVLVHHVDAGAALVLVVLVCSYEAGDYLVGSGSTTAVEGPAAGCIGVLVATFAVVVVRPDLFGGSASLWAMGVATGLACPLGQLAASAILPSGGTFAPALRRLDSYLVAAPLWAFVLLAGWLQVRPSLP